MSRVRLAIAGGDETDAWNGATRPYRPTNRVNVVATEVGCRSHSSARLRFRGQRPGRWHRGWRHAEAVDDRVAAERQLIDDQGQLIWALPLSTSWADGA